MRKATKSIISFAVILIAGLNLIVPAFAQDPFTPIAIGGFSGLSGAGLFSSMAAGSGVNFSWGNNDPVEIDAIWSSLHPDHVYFSGEKHEATGQGEDLYDYIQVDIGDWLEAQTDFISEFCENYNVTDNDSGTVSVNEWNGLTFGVVAPWSSSNTYYTGNLSSLVLPQTMGTSVSTGYGNGSLVVTCIAETDTNYTVTRELYYNNTLLYTSNRTENKGNTITYYLTYYTSFNHYYIGFWNGNPAFTITGVDITQYGSLVNVDLDWSSDTVNTSVYDGWENARVKIPHNISGLPTNWTVPDFTNALNNLWEQGLQGQIVIEDTDQPVPPPPVPVPSTPLGDVPFDDWVDLWGQGIWQQLENQSDALDFIGSNGTDAIEELESIDENIGALEETAESIDTNIGVGNGILGGIRSLAQSAVNYLEGIAEHVGELVEEIVAGTETLIAGILNQIPQAFGVIFGPIKQASSIWHYVVEWITSIGAPFQFIWSMASGTSYYVILPVYASLAAAVVLAFFKRFGR